MAKKTPPKPPPSAVETELAEVEKEYQRELKIIKARPVVIKVLLWLWIVLDTIFLVLFLYVVIHYLVAGSFAERRAVSGVANNLESLHTVTVSRAAQDLQIGDTSIFSSGEDTYDFYAEIENTNDDWYATFTYHFTTNRGDTEDLYGFVLPGAQKSVVSFRQEMPSRPSSMDLVIDDVIWSRVDHHEIGDIESWLAERDQFEITEASFVQNPALEGATIAKSSFTISNNSPYDYWSADFLIKLERNGVLLGINQVSLPGLVSGESREVEVNWFGAVPSAAVVDVSPDINYLDSDTYMPPEGDPELDIRDRF